MDTSKNVSRRNFIKQSSLGLGAGMVSLPSPSLRTDSGNGKKLPSEVRVVSVDMKGLWPDATGESRMKNMLERMDSVAGLHPDIICLPELFASMWVGEKKPIRDVAEDEKEPGPIARPIAAFARKNKCYVVCPLFTKKDGHYYNSSLLIDREGNIAGVYHKTHPVKSELLPDQDFIGSVIPGAFDQPVVETDFGKVGMQICYDANWVDGWDNLKQKGASLVLFSSAFPGGRMLNYYALKNNYYIVSSTGGDARVIDVSGNDLDATSEFVRYAWATINLERVNVTTWPTRDVLPAVFKKYGDRLGIKVWGTTDVITMESRDPELKILNVLKEFNIPTYAALLSHETEVQNKYRPG